MIQPLTWKQKCSLNLLHNLLKQKVRHLFQVVQLADQKALWQMVMLLKLILNTANEIASDRYDYLFGTAVIGQPGTGKTMSRTFIANFILWRAKEDKKNDIWFTDDAKMEKVSDNTIDLYTSFTEIAQGTMVTVWFDLGGAYLASSLDRGRTEEAKKVLQRYGHAISKIQAKENWDQQEEVLTNLENELKDLEKDHSDIQKKIEDLKTELMEVEAQARQNLAEQQSKQNAIKAQEKAVDTAKSIYKKH